MTKAEIRQQILKRRRLLAADQIEKLSGKINQKLIGMQEFKNAKIFAIYLPIHNEVETKPIINNLLKNQKDMYLPTFDQKANDYQLSKFSGWQNLVKGPYEILQPRDAESINSQLIDVAFIPGVAFSKSGVRVGYGKGVYDRLFAKSKAIKIGLAYEFQMVDELPKEEHDLIMDVVITENKIYKFAARRRAH